MGLSTSKAEALTEDEINLVTSSWDILMKDPEQNGIIILKTFLDKYDLYSKFEKFRNIPREGIGNNKSFRDHAALIMNTINRIILAAGDITTLKTELISLGVRHGKRDIKIKHFEDLNGIILGILEENYHLPKPTINAWSKILNLGLRYVCEGLSRAQPTN